MQEREFSNDEVWFAPITRQHGQISKVPGQLPDFFFVNIVNLSFRYEPNQANYQKKC